MRPALVGAVALLAMLACSAAAALPLPDVVGLHLYSLHAESGRSAPGSRGWNNANFGIYARWKSGLTIGAYRNSLFRDSAYAGWTFHDDADRFAVTVGVVSGYDKTVTGRGDRQAVRCADTCRTVNLKSVYLPLLAPSVRIGLTDRASLRLTLLAAPKHPPAVHLSIEGRF